MSSEDQGSKGGTSPALFIVIVALVILSFLAFLLLKPRGPDTKAPQNNPGQPISPSHQ